MSQKLLEITNHCKILQSIGWNVMKWINLRWLFQNAYENLTLVWANPEFVFYSFFIESWKYFRKLTMGTVWKESHCKIYATSVDKHQGAHQNLMKITHFHHVGIRGLMRVKVKFWTDSFLISLTTKRRNRLGLNFDFSDLLYLNTKDPTYECAITQLQTISTNYSFLACMINVIDFFSAILNSLDCKQIILNILRGRVEKFLALHIKRDVIPKRPDHMKQ